MSTNLTRIGSRARANPALVFTSLYHHITDIDNLRDGFRRLKGKKALGVDGVSKAMYEKDLEANLRDLSARLKRMGYRPKPKRRTYVPKPGSEKGRPLGISSFEDKIVELAAKRVLEPLFESLFDDCSYPRRTAQTHVFGTFKHLTGPTDMTHSTALPERIKCYSAGSGLTRPRLAVTPGHRILNSHHVRLYTDYP